MKENQEQKWKDTTLKSLEAKLRNLPEVEVPETLEAKLLAAIPDREPVAIEHSVRQHPGAWDFGATAAAVILILALIFTVNYGLSTPSQMLSAQPKDTSLCYTGWEPHYLPLDQNNALVEDTNYTNCNGQW